MTFGSFISWPTSFKPLSFEIKFSYLWNYLMCSQVHVLTFFAQRKHFFVAFFWQHLRISFSCKVRSCCINDISEYFLHYQTPLEPVTSATLPPSGWNAPVQQPCTFTWAAHWFPCSSGAKVICHIAIMSSPSLITHSSLVVVIVGVPGRRVVMI